MDLNCVMNETGAIIELQGTGEGRPFTMEEQRALVELCAKGIRELQAVQKAVLEGGGPMKVVLASQNKKKIVEMRTILSQMGWRFSPGRGGA